MIGGPLSFIGGLFCLGTSWVAKIKEDAIANYAEAKAAKEANTYRPPKYFPPMIIEDMIFSARTMLPKGFGGFDGDKINKFLLEQTPLLNPADVNEMRAGNLVKYFLKQEGFAYSWENIMYKYAIPHLWEECTTDEFRTKEYFIIRECETIDELKEALGEDWAHYLDEYNAPYAFIKRAIEKKQIDDFPIPRDKYWVPIEAPVENNEKREELLEMNNGRRKKIKAAKELLAKATAIMKEVANEERFAYDSLPDGLQMSERGCQMDDNADILDSVYELLEEANDNINDALEELESII